VHEGSPAAVAGLVQGDRLIALGELNTKTVVSQARSTNLAAIRKISFDIVALPAVHSTPLEELLNTFQLCRCKSSDHCTLLLAHIIENLVVHS
jgi:hypothetical protein